MPTPEKQLMMAEVMREKEPKGKQVVGEMVTDKGVPIWLTNFGNGTWPKDKPLPEDVSR